jgi:hypothetical protein
LTSDPWLTSSINDIDNIDDNSNRYNDKDLFDRTGSTSIRVKKAFRNGYQFGNEERRKKFLGESASFQGGHSLQGLWAMPGRR